MEPVVGNMGLVEPSREFLQTARTITEKHGAILVFDEVMTGFRLAFGGAQELYGVTPDITTLGKIVGGGLPLGAYGGKADIMNQVLPAGKVFQAGTLSGNPLAVAAGAATLAELKDHPPYKALDQNGKILEEGFRNAAVEAGIPCHIARVGSMMTIFFQAGAFSEGTRRVTGWKTARESNTEQYAKFFWGMIEHGVYLPCSQFEALFFSSAHTENEIQQTVKAAKQVLLQMASEA